MSEEKCSKKSMTLDEPEDLSIHPDTPEDEKWKKLKKLTSIGNMSKEDMLRLRQHLEAQMELQQQINMSEENQRKRKSNVFSSLDDDAIVALFEKFLGQCDGLSPKFLKESPEASLVMANDPEAVPDPQELLNNIAENPGKSVVLMQGLENLSGEKQRPLAAEFKPVDLTVSAIEYD